MQTEHHESWWFESWDAKACARFAREGFAVVENVLDGDTVNELRVALAEAARTGAAHQRQAATYGMRNLLQQVPAICKLADAPAVRALVEPVLGAQAFPVKGILFDKTAGANWKVAWHQDTAICVRERRETPGFSGWSVKDGVVNVLPPAAVLSGIMTVRLHLDDCDADNGALRVLPGSHRAGRLTAAEIDSWRERVPAVTCAVRAGGALLMRPLTLHASSAALSPRHRRVIHLEFAAQGLPGGLEWAVNSCRGRVAAAT